MSSSNGLKHTLRRRSRRRPSQATYFAAKPGNLLVANNMYDAEYMKHFTGLNSVTVLPSLCIHKAAYQPVRQEILVGPSRLSPGGERYGKHLSTQVIHLTNPVAMLNFHLHAQGIYTCILLILIEQYIVRTSSYRTTGTTRYQLCPLWNITGWDCQFRTQPETLVDWQMNFKVMDELLWNCVQQACEKPTVIKAHRDSPHVGTDPNDIMNKTNLLYWLRFADFYQ